MAEAQFNIIYVDGRFYPQGHAAISPMDRGFTLGDGLFETMRAFEGRVLRLPQHLSRLLYGASVLEIPVPGEEQLTKAIEGVLSRVTNGHALLRLTISRGIDQGRGVTLSPKVTPTLVIRASPFVSPPEADYERGLRAIISSIRRNESSPLSRIKSSNYGDSILARREAQRQGYDEAVMLNTRGEAACATTANLFMVKEGTLYTPDRSSGILPGITRACILEIAETIQIPVLEAPLGGDSLLAADEVFITNTVLGVMPLVQVGDKPFGHGQPGTITYRLAEAYDSLIKAELSFSR